MGSTLAGLTWPSASAAGVALPSVATDLGICMFRVWYTPKPSAAVALPSKAIDLHLCAGHALELCPEQAVSVEALDSSISPSYQRRCSALLQLGFQGRAFS